MHTGSVNEKKLAFNAEKKTVSCCGLKIVFIIKVAIGPAGSSYSVRSSTVR